MKILKSDGWFHVRTQGDHWQFKHKVKSGKVTLPHPKRFLGRKTIKSIMKQAKIELEEYQS